MLTYCSWQHIHTQQQKKSLWSQRATWCFGDKHQTCTERIHCSATGKQARVAFSESCFNCTISQPCNSFHVPGTRNTFICVPNYGCLPRWNTLRTHLCIPSLHAHLPLLFSMLLCQRMVFALKGHATHPCCNDLHWDVVKLFLNPQLFSGGLLLYY